MLELVSAGMIGCEEIVVFSVVLEIGIVLVVDVCRPYELSLSDSVPPEDVDIDADEVIRGADVG